MVLVGEQIELYTAAADGSDVRHLTRETQRILTRHRHGGQSQNRLARLQTESVDAYMDKAHSLAHKHFVTVPSGSGGPSGGEVATIAGLVIAGSAHKRLHICAGLHPLLQRLYLGTVSANGEQDTVQELFKKAQPLMRSKLQEQEDAQLQCFFDALERAAGVAVYGPSETQAALERGDLETLFVHSSLSPSSTGAGAAAAQQVEALAASLGTSVKHYSGTTQLGQRLVTLSGRLAGIRWFKDGEAGC
jgi:peptide subunit release factor 1 (eRF1)